VPDVLRCEGLHKSFDGRVAVDGVSFAIAAGETYGLLGPNGAGKTTTISIACGLLTRDAGTVVVAGRALDEDPLAAKALIGYVPQEIALYPDLTGAENLVFFGRLQGLAGRALSARVDAVLELVGLADRRSDRVEKYSGGMQRRLNIAAGMLHEPTLLILDEPTAGVDPQSRNAILEAVDELGGRGLAVLYTTHYMEEAERLCDRIGILDEGRLIAEGTRSELLAVMGGGDRVRLSGSGDLSALAQLLRGRDGVARVEATDSEAVVLVADAGRMLPGLLEAAGRAEVTVTGVEVEQPDLEAVFLHLTGKALRDR
jgi:ABC-2 type transport system ATP-binding protein